MNNTKPLKVLDITDYSARKADASGKE